MRPQNWSTRVLTAFSRRSNQRPVSVSKLLELKLQLQALEDRCVPATFTVTNINDLGAGSLRQAIIDANAHAATTTERLRDAERAAAPIKENARKLKHMAKGLCAETMRVGSDTWHMTDKECPRKTKVHCAKCNASFCGIHGGTSPNGYPKHNCERVKALTFQLGIGAAK